jgi:hypothetical protein
MCDARHAAFETFIRDLATWQARALAGDRVAHMVVNEYGLCRWAGHRPTDALAIAKNDVRAAGWPLESQPAGGDTP